MHNRNNEVRQDLLKFPWPSVVISYAIFSWTVNMIQDGWHDFDQISQHFESEGITWRKDLISIMQVKETVNSAGMYR